MIKSLMFTKIQKIVITYIIYCDNIRNEISACNQQEGLHGLVKKYYKN